MNVEDLYFTTVLIETEWGGLGTGFFVSRPSDVDASKENVFLVTNKHVISEIESQRSNMSKLKIHINFKNEDGSIVRRFAEITNLNENKKIWYQHTDPEVDVLAINVTGLRISAPQIISPAIPYEMFINPSKVEQFGIGIAEDLLVIGYPFISGLRHQTTNLPFVRQGLLASNIAENLEDDYQENSETRTRILRGFLIDGAIIPGSSGSPVLLKPSTSRQTKDGLSIGYFPPVLLGIIAETRSISVGTREKSFLTLANVGFAFHADTIRETVELFFEP